MNPIMATPFKTITDWITNYFDDFIINVINAMPVLLVSSFGVYVLIGMFSKTLAKIGVFATIGYGLLVIIA